MFDMILRTSTVATKASAETRFYGRSETLCFATPRYCGTTRFNPNHREITRPRQYRHIVTVYVFDSSMRRTLTTTFTEPRNYGSVLNGSLAGWTVEPNCCSWYLFLAYATEFLRGVSRLSARIFSYRLLVTTLHCIARSRVVGKSCSIRI